MPSPTTPVLDTFTRADENPLSGGGNWADGGLGRPLQLLSNQAAGGPAATSSISYWTPTVFNANQEGYATRSVIGTTFDSDFGIVCRQTRGGGQYTGYLGSIIQPHPSTVGDELLPLLGIGGGALASYQGFVRLSVIVNNVNVRIVLTPYTISANAVVWLNCVGSAITVYVDNGSGFSAVIAVTDTTIPGAGNLALYNQESTARADNFGGGNV